MAARSHSAHQAGQTSGRAANSLGLERARRQSASCVRAESIWLCAPTLGRLLLPMDANEIRKPHSFFFLPSWPASQPASQPASEPMAEKRLFCCRVHLARCSGGLASALAAQSQIGHTNSWLVGRPSIWRRTSSFAAHRPAT